ncbi:hypothetical protein GA0070558_12829 [Micromonospora haikouensis]|uniref:Uncharacterized protein n=1 Tax=Micromonospora haikouensis TaxID=686309 RepID=A0A1C4XNI4_9ACTN|nr:hypothetical protein [Micromonospora haikouensis]SCF10048.1 hypothetical protein GA0070558_12829 [Micromonospora haikouensis]
MSVFPPLPGCGELASVRIEVYGGGGLDAAAYACAGHAAPIAVTIEAAGWSACPTSLVPESGRPCGHVYRYPTGGLADPPGDAHPRWCDRDGCAARRRHRSTRLPLTPRSPAPPTGLLAAEGPATKGPTAGGPATGAPPVEAPADVALAQALVPGAGPVLVVAVGGAEPGELMLTLDQGRVLSYRLRRLLDLAAATHARHAGPGVRPRNRRGCP